MLGKRVQKILEKYDHNVVRAIQAGLQYHENSELYIEVTKLKRVLVTCDSDFESNSIGRLGGSSIIYLKVSPDNSLKHLEPVLESQIPKIPNNLEKDYLITIDNDDISTIKFEG
jgi:predicted nuclease of predicted toxin-antitoxin system